MTRQNSAFACFALALLIILGIGIVHYTATEPLSWYRAALGVGWDQLTPGTRAVFVTYFKIAGTGQIGVSVALGIILFIPYRRGEAWARWTLLIVGGGASLLSSYGILTTELSTGASVPWYNPLASLVLIVAGFLLSPASGKFPARR